MFPKLYLSSISEPYQWHMLNTQYLLFQVNTKNAVKSCYCSDLPFWKVVGNINPSEDLLKIKQTKRMGEGAGGGLEDTFNPGNA